VLPKDGNQWRRARPAHRPDLLLGVIAAALKALCR
jgi:hypothetical protein